MPSQPSPYGCNYVAGGPAPLSNYSFIRLIPLMSGTPSGVQLPLIISALIIGASMMPSPVLGVGGPLTGGPEAQDLITSEIGERDNKASSPD